MSGIEKVDRHICFVNASSYPLFTEDVAKSIGGVDTRSVHLAEMMAKYFTKISFAIHKTEGKIINERGLAVVKYEPVVISNAPNLEIVNINADIYIVFESHYQTADIVRTCNIIKRPVVLWATSNNDFNALYKLYDYKSYTWNFVSRESAYCLYFSDYIISQSFDQKHSLFKNHGLTSNVIKNPIAINENDFIDASIKVNVNGPVLWIGRTDPHNKRPELLLKIAERLMHIKFLMILNNNDDKYYKRILRTKTANIEIINYVPPEKMHEVFEKSSLFLSTSSKEFEGFPNVFLHAISHGLPIVSLEVDPDGIFSNHGCGICCNGDINLAVESIITTLNDKAKTEEIVHKAFRYAKQNHSIEIIEKQMVTFFSSIPLKTDNKVNTWAEHNFNRVNEQLINEYNQLQLDFHKLRIKHSAMINSRLIRLLNVFRKSLGKKAWM